MLSSVDQLIQIKDDCIDIQHTSTSANKHKSSIAMRMEADLEAEYEDDLFAKIKSLAKTQSEKNKAQVKQFRYRGYLRNTGGKSMQRT